MGQFIEGASLTTIAIDADEMANHLEIDLYSTPARRRCRVKFNSEIWKRNEKGDLELRKRSARDLQSHTINWADADEVIYFQCTQYVRCAPCVTSMCVCVYVCVLHMCYSCYSEGHSGNTSPLERANKRPAKLHPR